jgi:DNA invertase Pin-like site-specific DNA recombinase
MTSSQDAPPAEEPFTPAAIYVRMSTEHQQYSTSNQEDALSEYAARRRYRIVRKYADEGKSGLRIEGRPALRQLIDDVRSGNAGYRAILVYDVSRWGRFQDSDESAFYEYTCRQAGIEVAYCAEQFENDGSPVSTIIKSVKRAMAGEYSRELSNKVFKGQCRLIELGFRQGGPPGYGLRRMLVDQGGTPKGILKRGEHKSLQTDRVILVPGPAEELAVVQRIYRGFTQENLKEGQIAEALAAEKVPPEEGVAQWTPVVVRQILTNEKYIGNNVYNRMSFKLKKKRVRNAADMWVRAQGAFTSIVDAAVFYTARGILLERARRLSDAELIAKLKGLLDAHGTLSAALIDGADAVPSSCVYRNRFGSLLRAYELAGFRPSRDFQYLEINQHLKTVEGKLVADVLARFAASGASALPDKRTGLMLINGQYTVEFLLTRSRQTAAGALRWLVAFGEQARADVTVVVRMDAANHDPADFYLLPRVGLPATRLHLREENEIGVDTYRFDTLAYLVTLAGRTEAEEAA